LVVCMWLCEGTHCGLLSAVGIACCVAACVRVEAALHVAGGSNNKPVAAWGVPHPRATCSCPRCCCCCCCCCHQGLSGHLVEIIALLLLPVAIAMCGYAIFIFIWRSQMIAKKRVSDAVISDGLSDNVTDSLSD
jgi:hypothetical protein